MKKIILSIIVLLSLLVLMNVAYALPMCWCEDGEIVCQQGCTYTSGCDDCTINPAPTTCNGDCSGEFCGNNIVAGSEVCDYEEAFPITNYNLNGEDCQSVGFVGGTLTCAQDCTAFDTSGCISAICGNDVAELGEYCDGVDHNDETCQSLGYAGGTLGCIAPSNPNECTFDTSACTITTECGNGVCESGETGAMCPSDCGLYGWHTTDNGWSINAERRLVATTSGNAINIYSDPFEMRINSTYNLSVGLIESSCEGVYVDLNYGKCVSRTNWLEHECFTDQELNVAGETLITVPINSVTSTHASQGFFKNVSVRIHVPENCVAKFDNVSFKEVSPINPYHYLQPPINLTTACCPKEYCWTGSMCTLSDPWNSSIFPNIWNPLNLTGQIYQHINTSMQYLSRGYRCLVNETGYADWIPAQVKYDWDFRESGYCIKENDCFVGPEYIASDKSNCINNNQFMNDLFEIDKGNHYCMNGEWTTKTYLIANVLENLSTGKPYIIFCDDTGRIFNNLDDTQSAGTNTISGGCVLISKDGTTERIITGFYVAAPYDGDMICQWYEGFYNKMHPEMPIEGCLQQYGDDSCTPVNPPFERCVQEPDFNLYRNNESLYYLLSNEPIAILDEGFFQQLWNSIANFFQRLFGYTPDQPLGLANQTQNYEKLYVLSNNTLKVSAVEEKKYDEQLVRDMVYMYLNMTGSGMNDQANKFDINFVNNSVQGAYYTFDESSTSRVLVIKYNNPAELWPYLTAMLRDRP